MAASTSAAQITFSLAAPVSYNGSAITSYDIEYGTTAGGESTVVSSITATQMAAGYVVSGLANNQAYYGKIRARNAVGIGNWGAEATATTPANSSYVQMVTGQSFTANPSRSLPSAPTVGNIMVAVSQGDSFAGTPIGWTATGQWAGVSSQCIAIYYRVVQAGDTGVFTGAASGFDGNVTLFEFIGTTPPANVKHGAATVSGAHCTASTPATTSNTGASFACIEWNTGGAPSAYDLPAGSTLVYSYAGFSGGVYHGRSIAILPQAYLGNVKWDGTTNVASAVCAFFTMG